MTSNEKRTDVRVGILMGSDTDLPVMSEAAKVLEKFGIGYEMEVVSAHRTPARAHEYATTALQRGVKVLIAAAGAAAHLAGVIAANTTLPVIGVPMGTSSLNGLDALLATVQMPGGIPVATMAIDKAGAVNAAIFAAEILGLSDAAIARKLVEHKEDLVKSVEEKNARLQAALAEKKVVVFAEFRYRVRLLLQSKVVQLTYAGVKIRRQRAGGTPALQNRRVSAVVSRETTVSVVTGLLLAVAAAPALFSLLSAVLVPQAASESS